MMYGSFSLPNLTRQKINQRLQRPPLSPPPPQAGIKFKITLHQTFWEEEMVSYDASASASSSASSSSSSSSSNTITTTTNVGWCPTTSATTNGHNFALAGFTSGCATRFICHPLDVLKIRFQLQIEPISRYSDRSKYRSITQTFTCIVQEESMFALWKGHVSAQILSGLYGTAYFSSFEFFTQLSWRYLFPDERFISHQRASLVHFVCGSLSGFCATLLTQPFDVVRTRIISQSEHPRTYYNTRHAFRTIATQEGMIGFYRGFLPNVAQIVPFSGAQFATYHLFKRLWLQHFNTDKYELHLLPLSAVFNTDLHLNLQSSFICGAASGSVAKFLIYPFDLIKKRLQIRGFEAARGIEFGEVPHYRGFLHCIVYTIKHENLAAFYKGLVPSLFKATLTTALNFWLYETILKHLTAD